MALGARTLELQQALESYGETSVQNYRLLHKLGDEVVYGLATFLGEGVQVYGVPPEGDWNHNSDYRDAKFSTYHRRIITIEPILMGVAIRIPHAKDSGGFWLRVVVELEIERESISARVQDGKTVGGIALEYSLKDVERVQEAIFECAKNTLSHPVRTTRGTGRIGFLDEHS